MRPTPFPAPVRPERLRVLDSQARQATPPSGAATPLSSVISAGTSRDERPVPPALCEHCGAEMSEGFWLFQRPCYRHHNTCPVLAERETVRRRAARAALALQIRQQRSNLPEDVEAIGGLGGYVRRFGQMAGTSFGLNLCEAFLQAWERRQPPRDGFCLFGSQGSGKSTVLLALCRSLIEAGVDLRWESGPQLYARLLAASREGDLNDEFRRLTEFQVLAIDDLGREKASAWWVDQVLFPLVDSRYQAGRPMLLTSNYEWEPLQALYSQARSSSGEYSHSAPQLIDRLRQRCANMPFGPAVSLRTPDWSFLEASR